MNEQVEQKANELLLGLIDKAQAGMEFAETQIPDVVHQLLVWNGVISGIWTCVALVMFAAVWKVWRSAMVLKKNADGEIVEHGWARDSDGDINDEFPPLFFICAVLSAIGLLILVLNMDWLKVWLAPKLYLLEYAASLAK